MDKELLKNIFNFLANMPEEELKEQGIEAMELVAHTMNMFDQMAEGDWYAAFESLNKMSDGELETQLREEFKESCNCDPDTE